MELDHEKRAVRGDGAGPAPSRAVARGGGTLADRVRVAGGALSEVLRGHRVTAVGTGLTTPAGLSVQHGTLDQGEQAPLPAADEELWILLRGRLRVLTVGGTLCAVSGDCVHVPENSPGRLEAVEDTVFVRVSVTG